MSTYENTEKTGHPVAGVILAVLGIVIALTLSLVFGVAAGAATLILGALAVLTGVRARRSGRGTGTIVTGVLAMVMAVVMSFTSVGIMNTMKDTAAESGVAPTFAENFDNPYLGIAGVIIKTGGDEAKLKVIVSEMDALGAYIRTQEASAGTAAAVTGKTPAGV